MGCRDGSGLDDCDDDCGGRGGGTQGGNSLTGRGRVLFQRKACEEDATTAGLRSCNIRWRFAAIMDEKERVIVMVIGCCFVNSMRVLLLC